MRLHKSHMFPPPFVGFPFGEHRPANPGSGKPRIFAVRPGFAAAVRDQFKEVNLLTC